MAFLARRAAVAVACALAIASPTAAQPGSPGYCRQGVLALIVMIDAEEHDKSHYRSTAASVVANCGPSGPAAQSTAAAGAFDKTACGKLALAMLEGIGESDVGNRQFIDARNEFAAKCMAR